MLEEYKGYIIMFLIIGLAIVGKFLLLNNRDINR